MWASFARSGPRPAYRPTDGSYRATAAPLWRRGTAGLVDWVLVTVCYLLVNIPLGVIQAVSDEVGGAVGLAAFVLTQIAGLAVVAGYFAFFVSTGHTLGMRALDIHVVELRSGRNPAVARATARGVLSVVFFLASFTAYTYVLGHYGGGLSRFEETVRAVSITAGVVAFLGHVWQVADSRGRSLWDRLAGLAVVEDMVPTSMPDRLWSPWGT